MDEIIEQIFKKDGLLSKLLPDYQIRQQQIDCTKAIVNEDKKHLFLEAGTGSGKTFQNLIGTLLRSVKKDSNSWSQIIYVTSSKVLQDQLETKDLKLVKKLFQMKGLSERFPRLANLSYGVLKGISNYVCKLKMATVDDNELEGKYNKITGIVDETIPYEIKEKVTMPADGCLGNKCAFRDNCYYRAERHRVTTSNIIVLNYHLFFSLLVYRDQITPAENDSTMVSTVVFDEAHNSAGIFRSFTEKTLDEKRLNFLGKQFKDHKKLFFGFKEILNPIEVNSGLVVCNREYAVEIYEEAKPLIGKLTSLMSAMEALADATSGVGKATMKRKLAFLSNLYEFWGTVEYYGDSDNNKLFFYSDKSHSLSFLNIDLSDAFGSLFDHFKKALFIHSSATIMVNKNPKYLASQIGLTRKDYNYRIFPAVFDYNKQCRAIAVDCIPNNEKHFSEVIKAIGIAYDMFGGKTLVLCTSIKAMSRYYDSCKHPCMCQNIDSKQDILDRLRDPKNDTVVFATRSFFEGIDIKGEGLSCLILDKLPFLQPNDPLVKGYEQLFGDAFMNVSLPDMVLTLKQASGRLIRHESDVGLFILCESRIKTARYGNLVESSLPFKLKLMELDKLK